MLIHQKEDRKRRRNGKRGLVQERTGGREGERERERERDTEKTGTDEADTEIRSIFRASSALAGHQNHLVANTYLFLS